MGETGTGKTTLCQTLAFVRSQPLLTINCNMHTEAADFLGGYRPARNRIRALADFVASYNKLARCASPALPSTQHASTLDFYKVPLRHAVM